MTRPPPGNKLLSVVLLAFAFSITSNHAAPIQEGLIDPDLQPKFATVAPNLLDEQWEWNTTSGFLEIAVQESQVFTGLVDPTTGDPLPTPIYGYGTEDTGFTWPGKTVIAQSYQPLQIKWENQISPGDYLLTDLVHGESILPDESSTSTSGLPWAYGLTHVTTTQNKADKEDRKGGRKKKNNRDSGVTVEHYGVPIVPRLHGGHVASTYEGDPEAFFGPGLDVTGSEFAGNVYTYQNQQPATCLWFHDQTLGISSFNIYAGLSALYILRDIFDTGLPDNPLHLPAGPYEAAFVIQDRMFKENGELYFPSSTTDATTEAQSNATQSNATMHPETHPQPAQPDYIFLGDVMTVNGKIWPKYPVEPRRYRLRLLNACHSRFLAIQFRAEVLPTTDNQNNNNDEEPTTSVPLQFTLLGGGQGLSPELTTRDTLLMEPSSRYDILLDFQNLEGFRLLMTNTAGDEPFRGDTEGSFRFSSTNVIMALDVELELDDSVPEYSDFDVAPLLQHLPHSHHPPGTSSPLIITKKAGLSAPSLLGDDEEAISEGYVRVRKLAVFGGIPSALGDPLPPLLGTAEPAVDAHGNPILWPDSRLYEEVGLASLPMEGSLPWHAPITENPQLHETEVWEIYSFAREAHPIHVSSVTMEVLSRHEIRFDSGTRAAHHTSSFHFEIPMKEKPVGDGTYLERQSLVNWADGNAADRFRVANATVGARVPDDDLFGFSDYLPRDVVALLPKQVTRIKMQFEQPGQFTWQSQMLSLEDQEMIRAFYVGEMSEYEAQHIEHEYEQALNQEEQKRKGGSKKERVKTKKDGSHKEGRQRGLRNER
ncbi:Multicopper oxidase LPR1 homolog [Seminavis robusta]|uniref:Multicopper oxidase LPR1 homolog n=1 Tax=Seminavis robusta TaxID=568900 RepID=A0A9N8DDQ3_9STRA|nr:Multicopper oxidase LPR1 homolog [Seminavis robusta]|eukprot:Sro46_g027480.1 Multicopper oxidase LPR1 homolog (821) ;mRNA; r:76774-79338